MNSAPRLEQATKSSPKDRALASCERRLGKLWFAENFIKNIFVLISLLLIEKSLVLIYNFMDVFMSSCLIAFDVT